MESYESMLFPGPHAFLLVHRDVKNSGRDNYLLHALSDVFGKKVLDYCMVLFIDGARHNDPNKNYCLKMCGGRNHTLQNTEYSVNELFKKIETMTESKDNSFFTTHLECFRKASNYFQEKYEEKENELRKELNDSKGREDQLRDDIEKLRRKMEVLKEQLKNNLTDARVKEDSLHKRERNVHRREKQLAERQKELEIREREVTQRDVRSREHHQTTADPAVSENKDRPLYDREGKLKRRNDSQSLRIQKPVRRNSFAIDRPNMYREHHQTTADPPSAEREGELKSRDDSQTRQSLGIQKPAMHCDFPET
ncbi:ribonuclease Y-like isoform X2 [Ctenopharyngodon idella]|uniref:ribonuclease Y-like isoform X2 n=1 Tax=Ctenopharyngodon idella TaxID=7959 RepID=UPI00222F1B7C|nr:ribonuclease Y-like isoform X2 [Ctenopharyngodon idella]